MAKAIQQSSHAQNHEAEAEKSQNHHSHSANGECENSVVDVFRWSRCKKPLPQKVMRSVGIPLPHEHVEVLLLLAYSLSCLCCVFIHLFLFVVWYLNEAK